MGTRGHPIKSYCSRQIYMITPPKAAEDDALETRAKDGQDPGLRPAPHKKDQTPDLFCDSADPAKGFALCKPKKWIPKAVRPLAGFGTESQPA
jgi:hypothetical protein